MKSDNLFLFFSSLQISMYIFFVWRLFYICFFSLRKTKIWIISLALLNYESRDLAGSLRAGEIRALETQCLVPPRLAAAEALKQWGLYLFSLDRHQMSKTGQLDDIVVLDSATRPWLGSKVALVARYRRWHRRRCKFHQRRVPKGDPRECKCKSGGAGSAPTVSTATWRERGCRAWRYNCRQSCWPQGFAWLRECPSACFLPLSQWRISSPWTCDKLRIQRWVHEALWRQQKGTTRLSSSTRVGLSPKSCRTLFLTHKSTRAPWFFFVWTESWVATLCQDYIWRTACCFGALVKGRVSQHLPMALRVTCGNSNLFKLFRIGTAANQWLWVCRCLRFPQQESHLWSGRQLCSFVCLNVMIKLLLDWTTPPVLVKRATPRLPHVQQVGCHGCWCFAQWIFCRVQWDVCGMLWYSLRPARQMSLGSSVGLEQFENSNFNWVLGRNLLRVPPKWHKTQVRTVAGWLWEKQNWQTRSYQSCLWRTVSEDAYKHTLANTQKRKSGLWEEKRRRWDRKWKIVTQIKKTLKWSTEERESTETQPFKRKRNIAFTLVWSIFSSMDVEMTPPPKGKGLPSARRSNYVSLQKIEGRSRTTTQGKNSNVDADMKINR